MPEETRDKIVAAAYRSLSERGYEGTSIKDIAAAAGVAPGLVHYYFRSKEDLLVAAIEFACRDMALVEGADPVTGATKALVGVAGSILEHRAFFQLFFDMVGVGLHNQAVAAAVRRFVAVDRGQTEAITAQVLAARGLSTVNAGPIGAAVWAGIIGLALQAMVDPGFDLGAAAAAHAAMVMSADTAAVESFLEGRAG